MADNIKRLERERELQEQINKLQEQSNDLNARKSAIIEKLAGASDDLKNRLEKELKSVNSELDQTSKRVESANLKFKKLNDLRMGTWENPFKEQNESINSLSSIYSDFAKKQSAVLSINKDITQSLLTQRSIGSIQSKNVKVLSSEILSIGDSQRQLLELGESDATKRSEILDTIKSQAQNVADTIELQLKGGKINETEAKSLATMLGYQTQLTDEATNYSNVSKEAKSQVESQIEAYDTMKKSVRGVLDTIRLTLQTPQALIIGASVAAGKFASAMGDVAKETGQFNTSAAGLSFIFDDTTANLKEIAKLTGDVKNATFSAQFNTGLLALTMGTTGVNVATVADQFGKLQGKSQEFGNDMVGAVGQAARLNGVLPSQVLEDMASSTEFMAKYSAGSVDNFKNAAIQAAKLGVSLQTQEKIAGSLLDFETSIENELEASAMLGRDLNLGRARELFYLGKTDEATKEVLKNMGGINAFNKLDVYQKDAVAKSLGISVSELQKMVANQDNLNNNVPVSKYSEINEYLRGIGQKFGGPIASGATFLVGELIRAKLTAAALNGTLNMKSTFDGIKSGASGAFSFLQRLVGITPATTVTQTVEEAAKTSVTQSVSEKLKEKTKEKAEDILEKKSEGIKDVSKGASAINPATLLSAAVAMIAFAGAIYILAKAFQEFDQVKDMGKTLTLFAVSLVGMAGMLYIAGTMITAGAEVLIPAAGILLAFGASVALVGLGIKLAAEGFATFVTAMSSVSNVMPSIIGQILELSQINFLPILGLAVALTTLAVALSAVAAAGVLALPALAGMGKIAAGVGTLFGGGEGGENKELLNEIKALHTDLINGKIAVYMDGQKVMAQIARANANNPLTLKAHTV